MARLTFNTPFMLGFDHLEQMLEQFAKAGNDTNYPPYNIEQIAPRRLKLSLAVAGYSENELEVALENNQLIICAHPMEEPEKQFLYKGIAHRQFRRSFMLAQGMKIKSASLEQGLLSIDLEQPAHIQKTTKIKINTPAQKKIAWTTDD
ncbi:MAG: Hsp20 family protein [Alphaproteobacteria bacterium]|nr:Hsp20 family protein [Alphaproteobacteria bacterium]